MNSCVLMGKIVRNPQLRYTQDNQMAIADMMVEFDNLSPNSPPCTMKVVAWGNLATDIEQKYREGNEVILSGRLKMDLVEKQGYKEKIAELTISHIYPAGGGNTPPSNKVVDLSTYQSSHNSDDNSNVDDVDDMGDHNLDNIPF